MCRWFRRVVLVALTGATSLHVGCAEAVAPRAHTADLDFVLPKLNLGRAPSRVEPMSSSGDSGTRKAAPRAAGDAIPSEFNQEATIKRYYTVAGFTDDAQLAYASATMFYHANRARQTVDLTLRFNGSEIGSTSGESEDSYLFPGDRVMFTQATLGIGGQCGHAAHARGTHKVWNEFFTSNQGVLSWKHQTTTSNDSPTQPPCLQSGTGHGAGGGWDDGTLYICYYYDWYDYMGGFLFREWTFCVPLNAE